MTVFDIVTDGIWHNLTVLSIVTDGIWHISTVLGTVTDGIWQMFLIYDGILSRIARYPHLNTSRNMSIWYDYDELFEREVLGYFLPKVCRFFYLLSTIFCLSCFLCLLSLFVFMLFCMAIIISILIHFFFRDYKMTFWYH